MSQICKLTAAATAELEDILAIDFENERADELPQLVGKKDRVLQLLKEGDCSYEEEIYPKFVGVDPSNRNEELMTADGVHGRGVKIVKAGWSFAACQGEAVGMEDDPVLKMVAKHTCKMSSLSPSLARMVFEEIRVGSLGAGHTNQWLCCVIDGVKLVVPCAEITEKGCIAKDKIFAKDKPHEKACTIGIRWTVIRHPCRGRFPRLASFLQSALNVKNHITQGDLTNFNCMLCLLRLRIVFASA